MDNLTKKWIFYPVLILIILLSSIGLYYHYKFEVTAQWRDAVKLVELNSARNDAVVLCNDFSQLPFDYYYKGELPISLINCSGETHF